MTNVGIETGTLERQRSAVDSLLSEAATSVLGVHFFNRSGRVIRRVFAVVFNAGRAFRLHHDKSGGTFIRGSLRTMHTVSLSHF
jgi:hypothetical protein